MRIFITGTNRGIGLELVRRYLERDNRVFAACRKPDEADELQKLNPKYSNQLTIIKLEVTSQEEIEAAGQVVEGAADGLDLLINNAGMAISGEKLGDLSSDAVLHVFSVNAVAPLMIAKRFCDLLAAGDDPKLINVSSQLGSLARKTDGGRYSYTSSKAALNMFTRALAFDLKPQGITTVTIHPGWVQTDMGGENAPITVQESCEGILQLIDGLALDDSGRFLNWEGEELPW